MTVPAASPRVILPAVDPSHPLLRRIWGAPHPGGPWPKVRAALLAVVIALHGWLALPVPPAVDPGVARRPEVREELDRWHAFLSGLGVQRTKQELLELTVSVTGALSAAHRGAVAPVRPLLKLTKTGQGWALFASPDTHPWRLEAHAKIDGRWQLVFRRLDPDHARLAGPLSFRRVRGVYDSGSARGTYKSFARWLGNALLDELPEASHVRVRLVRLHVVRPGEPPDRKERPRHEVVTARDRGTP